MTSHSFSQLLCGAVLAPLAVLLTSAHGSAQCANSWLAGPALAGTDGGTGFIAVYAAVEWDRDGSGPLPPLVVIGGEFTVAGSLAASNIAAFDPVTGTWTALGSGANARVQALAVLPNGDLVAGGVFSTIGGIAATGIARWNGTTWSPLGNGISGGVRALAVMANGDLAAGGAFQSAIGSVVARWNGVSWSAFGAGLGTGGPIYNPDFLAALVVRPNGDLVAGGLFSGPGGGTVSLWNGTTWTGLGATVDVQALAVLPNGNVVAGGSAVVQWNGASWVQLGTLPQSSLPVTCFSLGVLANGDPIASSGSAIATWNGTTWTTIGPCDGLAKALVTLASGDVVAGGIFHAIYGVHVANLAKWDGIVWSAIGAGTASPASSTTDAVELANGDIAFAGQCGIVQNGMVHRVFRWNGASLAQVGGDFRGEGISCLAQLPNGDLVAAGRFGTVGGVPKNGIVRWNGSSWQDLGGGWSVKDSLVLPNGDLVVAGSFLHYGAATALNANGIARWDGVAWHALGVAPQGEKYTLALAANGDLLVGTDGVIRWDGTAWSAVGNLAGPVKALAILPNGDIVAGGGALFPSLDRIARWNGTAWTPWAPTSWLQPSSAGSGGAEVRGLQVLPNGDVVATGYFFGGTAGVRGAMRWNGTVWSALAATGSGYPTSLVRTANGDLLMAGVNRMDQTVSAGFARLTTTCPATAVSYGAGCVGSAGVNQLTPTALPWIGSTYRARATGMPSLSFVAVLSGFTQVAVPLSLFLAEAGPACFGYVTGDVIDIVLPTAGVVTTQIAVPNQLALVGMQFHQYVVPFEFDAFGTLLAVTSSNALTVTVGHF